MEEAAGGRVEGTVSIRHDPMDAIEEAIVARHFDEIILFGDRRMGSSRWLHIDLPTAVAHLGLPMTTITAEHH